MEIQVETNEQDHLNFYKDYGFKRNWLQRTLALLLIDLVICVMLQNRNNDVVWSIFFVKVIIIAIILYPFYFVILYYLAKRRFEKAYLNQTSSLLKRTYKPFAVGIEVIEENGSSFIKSSTIKETGKAGNYIYMILSDGEYCILPIWCFSSDQEARHFLRIVNSSIANGRGVTGHRPSGTFKPIYLIGLLCLIPMIGAIVGIVLVILGIAHYKDKVFVIIGSVGILITVAIYGSLIYYSTNTNDFKKGFADIAQTQINDLVKSIEFYKLQHGAYPYSLQQVADKNSMIQIYDVSQASTTGKDMPLYHYKKVGGRYLLFSPGMDGKINTKDDIYPTLDNPDTSKLGFIRKK